MTISVKKRSGDIVEFDGEKIKIAIKKAFESVNEDVSKIDELFNYISNNFEDGKTYDIEFIQDLVEKSLIEKNFYGVAKAYIIYRKQHKDLRDMAFVLESNDMIDKYLGVLDWRVKENSNMGYSIQGLNNYISSKVTSNYWLNKIYPDEIRNAHLNGDFHIHDLNLLSVYCCGWDLKDLLLKGFGGVPGKVQSAPPKHFRSALGQIVNFFYTLQGEAAGAQAFANFDTYLAPFVRFDNLTYKEVKQAMQEFIFNLNVPTRVGFQTPFTNLTMDLIVPKNMENEPIILGGETKEETYKGFQKEMDLINKAFCEVMSAGDSAGGVFTFPIPTYNITKEFEWDDPNYKPIWDMTAKYGIPYFSNFINSDMSPDDARSMCCRLRLDNRELIKRGGGLFGSNPMTGSVGVVTIDMPRIGYLSKTKDEIFERLTKLMDLAKESLIIKRKVLEKYTEEGLYPYSKYYLADLHKRFGKYWNNHFSTIGLVGMNELCMNFLKKSITDPEGQKLALEIMDFMRKKMQEYQEETGILFNLEASPAEGTSYKLAKLDKEKYPDIIVANEDSIKSDKTVAPYYTNSTQLPVNFTDDVFEALDLQDELQSKYTGGTVFHMFLGENYPDAESVKKLVKKIAENYKLPYFTLSPTFSICPTHGYIGGNHSTCPVCGAKCEVYSRIVGYIRPVENWNEGKTAEFKDRITFDKNRPKKEETC